MNQTKRKTVPLTPEKRRVDTALMELDRSEDLFKVFQAMIILLRGNVTTMAYLGHIARKSELDRRHCAKLLQELEDARMIQGLFPKKKSPRYIFTLKGTAVAEGLQRRRRRQLRL